MQRCLVMGWMASSSAGNNLSAVLLLLTVVCKNQNLYLNLTSTKGMLYLKVAIASNNG